MDNMYANALLDLAEVILFLFVFSASTLDDCHVLRCYSLILLLAGVLYDVADKQRYLGSWAAGQRSGFGITVFEGGDYVEGKLNEFPGP